MCIVLKGEYNMANVTSRVYSSWMMDLYMDIWRVLVKEGGIRIQLEDFGSG